MKKILGKKQSIQNEEWLKARKCIGELVSREELDEKVRSTVEEVRQMTDGKKAAYAWSAGKDSLVLGEICRESGINDCMMAICNLEYPAFLKWVDRHKPKELEIINTGQNLELLTQSIYTNGWTLPIVVRPDYTIIDGFHRWTVAGPDWKYVPDNEKDQRILFDRLGGKVLIVIVRHEDHSGDIYGTVTHNRARGTHLLEPMKKIVKELLDSGKPIEEIGKQLGMRPEEVFRLSEFSREDFLRMMAKGTSEYSKAEFITRF